MIKGKQKDIKEYTDPKMWERLERFKEHVKPATWERMEKLFSRRDIDGVINAMLNFSEVAGTGICEFDALHWFQGYIADRVKGKNKREIEMCEAIIKAEMKKYPKWDRKQLR